MRQFYEPASLDNLDNIRIYSVTGHPVYRSCTLFFKGENGFGIVQQFFNKRLKCFWWDSISKPLAIDIFNNENFWEYFDKVAKEPDENGEYPIYQVRKVMYALKMKPLRRQYWETVE